MYKFVETEFIFKLPRGTLDVSSLGNIVGSRPSGPVASPTFMILCFTHTPCCILALYSQNTDLKFPISYPNILILLQFF